MVAQPASGPTNAAPPDPSAPLPFERHVRAFRAARFCELARHLPANDKTLVLLAHADGRSCTEIGALLGVSRQSVHRRLSRLRCRMLTPEFLHIAPRLHTLDRTLRDVAQICIIEGRSLREASRRLRLSQHAVREARVALLALLVVVAPRAGGAPRDP